MYVEERIGANVGSTYIAAVGAKCKADVGNCSGGMCERTRGARYQGIFSGSMVPVAGGYSFRNLTVLLRDSRVRSSKQRLAQQCKK